MRLGCKWDVSRHGHKRVSWSQTTLTDDRYTAESDLDLVEQLLTDPELPALEQSGNQFCKELISHSIDGESFVTAAGPTACLAPVLDSCHVMTVYSTSVLLFFYLLAVLQRLLLSTAISHRHR